MRLYATKNSTYSRRVRIALLEKGLVAEEVERAAEARRSPEFLALNPYGRIPVLVDRDEAGGEWVLWESTAILEYLEAKHPEPPLVPKLPTDRGTMAMHVKLCDLEFAPFARAIQRPKRFDPPESWDRASFEPAKAAILRHLAILATQLEGRRYLVADRFTLADLVYVPFLHFHGLLELELPDAVAQWWQRLSRRPSVRATEPTF